MNQNNTLEKAAEEAFITGTSIMQIDPTSLTMIICDDVYCDDTSEPPLTEEQRRKILDEWYTDTIHKGHYKSETK